VTDRSSHSARFSDETWDEFTSWVEEVEGQKHGEIGRHVKNALEEYMNKDRQARLERNQHEMIEQLEDLRAAVEAGEGTHTHKDNSGCTDTDLVTKVRDRVVNSADSDAVKDDVVEEAIVAVAELPVGDDRTIRKYKQRLRKRGLLFEHPGEPPLWTADTNLWANWTTRTAGSRNDLEAAVEPYPAQVYENGSGLQIEIEEVEI
jgi:hypothetical protein